MKAIDLVKRMKVELRASIKTLISIMHSYFVT